MTKAKFEELRSAIEYLYGEFKEVADEAPAATRHQQYVLECVYERVHKMKAHLIKELEAQVEE